MITDDPPGGEPARVTRDELLATLRCDDWQLQAALRRGLVADPGPDRKWSTTAARSAAARAASIIATVGDQRPYGAWRAADRLTELLGTPVGPSDVEKLAEAGDLATAGEYKGHTLYDVAQLGEVTREQLEQARAAHTTWIEASMTPSAARTMLGWSQDEFRRAIRERGITVGAGDRYARADIAALADDEALADAIESNRTLGPRQAADHLGIRPTDWRYLTAGGYITPVGHAEKAVGRWSTSLIPLYRLADVEALLNDSRIPWPALRDTGPGQPSPLRGLTQRRPDRATSVRRFAGELADRFPGIEAWATYQRGGAIWRIDWTQIADEPSTDLVAEMIAAHPVMRSHAGSLRLGSDQGLAIRTARRMIGAPGYGVILDFETTSLTGYPVEVGIVDAATGETLYEALIRPPAAAEMSQVAQEMHGLSLAALADAPEWPDVIPHVRQAINGRRIAAYNASFDHGIYLRACQKYRIDPGPARDWDTWWCVMEARADYHGDRYRTALGGGHRAIGDCLATRQVIEQLATLPPGTYSAAAEPMATEVETMS